MRVVPRKWVVALNAVEYENYCKNVLFLHPRDRNLVFINTSTPVARGQHRRLGDTCVLVGRWADGPCALDVVDYILPSCGWKREEMKQA